MEEGILIAEKTVPVKRFNASERLAICNKCPLYIKDHEVCNPYLWMNPSTKETSSVKKSGYMKGCGCLITRKARQPSSHCHLGLW